MGHQPAWGKNTRQRLAVEAARIMAEEGIADFHAAKRKAAHRLGVTTRQDLPSNQEIELELRVYQSLFHGENQQHHVDRLRRTALEAMQFLDEFDPRLVGSVLDGTAGQHTPVQLHIFADTPEDIDFFLMEKGVPFKTDTQIIKFSAAEKRTLPRVTFVAGDVPVQLVIFPSEGTRQAPCSPVHGRPMQRANLRTVSELLDAKD